MAASELARLEHLSLVSKICTELDNHYSLNDKVHSFDASGSGSIDLEILMKIYVILLSILYSSVGGSEPLTLGFEDELGSSPGWKLATA